MEKKQAEESRSGKKACQVCAEQINLAASKCVHCESYQDWRGSISFFSSSILSLLVALGSVMTLAVPVFVTAFTPQDSDLHFSFQGASQDSVSVVVINQGSRPGSVGRLALLEIPGFRTAALGIANTPVPATLVEPGRSMLLSFSYEIQQPKYIASKDTGLKELSELKTAKWDDLRVTNCTIRVSNTSFRATAGFGPATASCEELYSFIMQVAGHQT